LYKKNNAGSWELEGGPEHFYVNGSGTFDVPIKGSTATSGQIKYIAFYHSEEGGFACEPLSGILLM
jgi:hypothetical protein